MTADIESLQEFASDGAVLALSNGLTVVGQKETLERSL